jgi:hypothetical protein
VRTARLKARCHADELTIVTDNGGAEGCYVVLPERDALVGVALAPKGPTDFVDEIGNFRTDGLSKLNEMADLKRAEAPSAGRSGPPPGREIETPAEVLVERVDQNARHKGKCERAPQQGNDEGRVCLGP